METSLLGGKVFKHSLPVFRSSSGTNLPRLKRLLLPQGELAHFYDGPGGLNYVAFLELREGTLRANHYHKGKDEGLYMLSGELRLVLKDPTSGEQCSLSLEVGDIAIIQPGIAHALQTVRQGQAIEFSHARFDPADVYPFKLI